MTIPHGGNYLMTLTIDPERARDLVGRLHRAYPNPPMPEDVLPEGRVRYSPEYRLFLTLVVAIDYSRDADKLWAIARRTHDSPETRYLFNPNDLLRRPSHAVEQDFRQSGLLAGPHDFRTWITLSRTFHERFKGDPLNLLLTCDMEGPRILDYLRNHGSDFPYLKGQKIGPLWLRMLRDNAGLSFEKLEDVQIPVDVHVLRATLCLGVMTGDYEGPLDPLKERIAAIWMTAVKNQEIRDARDRRPFVSLDLDEALWTLGRTYCNKRNHGTTNSSCPGHPGCAEGRISVTKERVLVHTTKGRHLS